MSILELGPIAFGGTAAIVAFFQGKGLLANNINCAQCGVAMVLSDRADISDGCRWRCPQCRKCVTIRKGSFFEKSRLTLQKWLLLMHWWAKEYPVTDAAQEIEVDESTAIQVYQRSVVIDYESRSATGTLLWRILYGGQNTLDNLYRDISLWYPV